MEAFVAKAVLSVREIQVRQAPHIAEASDATMTRLENDMAGLEATAKAALSELSGVIAPSARPALAAAQTEFDRFKDVSEKLVALSRRNSNVRALDLSLRVKPGLTTACDESLRVLRTPWRNRDRRPHGKQGRRSRSVELNEEPIHFRSELGELHVCGQTLPDPASRLRAVADDHDLSRLRDDQPDDRNAVVQIPAGLFAQNAFVFVLTGYLDGQHRRRVTQPTHRGPHLRPEPDRSIRRANIGAQLHAGFVAPDDEARVAFGPRSQDMNDVDRDVLLNVSARRRVK